LSEEEQDIFKPRDFIYLNKEKLDSFFSQLFGGLIQSIDTSTQEGKQFQISGEGRGEVLGRFGLKGSSNLVQMVLNQFGDLEASLQGELSGEVGRTTEETSNTRLSKTLKHFQYSLFENSISELNYLIDLDLVDGYSDAGQLRGNLKATDFVKFKPSEIKVSDYRNVRNFVEIVKEIIDLYAEVKSGELMDEADEGDIQNSINKVKDQFKKRAMANIFSNAGGFYKNAKIVEVIAEAVTEVFEGDLIPLEVLLTSHFSTGNNSSITFESQLKDDFLLEERSDLSFKYSHFEDANWTIIGQITSLSGRSASDIEQAAGKLKSEFENLSEEVNINDFAKTFIEKLDNFTKDIGLQPQVGKRNVALTPIAIYREPKVNESLVNVE